MKASEPFTIPENPKSNLYLNLIILACLILMYFAPIIKHVIYG